MLDLFRKRGAMSVVYSLLMGAVILVFVIQFRPNSGSPIGALSRNCVAKVRGTCIDDKDWRAQRYLLRGPYEGGPQMNWNKLALDSLIERTLLEQEADRLGLRVTEDDVMNELIRDKVYVFVSVAIRAQARQIGVNSEGFRWTTFGTKDKPFDQQVFERVVRQTTGQNPTEFADSQLQELRAARMVAVIAERARVSDVEAWEEYRYEKSTTAVRRVVFDPQFFAERILPADTPSIEAWMKDHQKEVDDAEAKWSKDQEKKLVHLRQIVVAAKKDDAADKNAEARKKAEDVLDRLKKGEDFAKLAKDSSDLRSKDKGGEIDWTNGSELPEEVRNALGKQKAGETSIVESAEGFHVVQILGRLDGRLAVAFGLYREARGVELAKEAADRVAAELKSSLPLKVDDVLKARIEEATKGGKVEADATAQVIDDETRTRMTALIDKVLGAMLHGRGAPSPAWESDERRPKVDDSLPFAAGGSPVEGVADPKPLVEASAKLTREAPVAGPIKVGDGYFLLVLKDRHEATRAEFDKGRANFVGPLLARKREDAVVNYVTSLRESLTKDTLTIDARYQVDDTKKGPPGDQAPPIEQPEEP